MSDRSRMHEALQRIAQAADTMEPAQGFGFATSLARATLNQVDPSGLSCSTPGDPLSRHMDAALAAFRIRQTLTFGDLAEQGMREVGILKKGDTLRAARPYDALQVGRYMGELLHFTGNGTPASLWTQPVPRPDVEATPTELADLVDLLEEALQGRGRQGDGVDSQWWRDRATSLLRLLRKTDP